MRQKCECCNKRRNLRGFVLCDECAEEFWLANGGDEWLCDMKDYGWAVTKYDSHDYNNVVLVVERRWKPALKTDTPSRLWDQPTVGYA